MESDRLSERILNGKEHFRACMRASHAPFGYRVNNYRYELDTEPFLCLIKDQNEYSKAEMAYDLVENYLERKSLNGTCRYFTDRWGYDEFWASALRRWLTSQTLQGHLVYFPKSEKPIVNLNTHEPLITPEQASQIKEVIAFNHKIGGFGATRGKYPLTGLVVCSECGIKWVVGNGSKGEYKYFLCPKARKHACSQKKSIRQEVLEQAVIATLTAKAQELSERAAMSTTPTEPPELKELRSQLAGLEAIPGYNSTIEQAKEEITRQIQNLTYSSTLDQTVNEEDQNFLKQVFSEPDFWSSLLTEGKQRVFRRLVDRVEVRNGTVVAVHLRV